MTLIHKFRHPHERVQILVLLILQINRLVRLCVRARQAPKSSAWFLQGVQEHYLPFVKRFALPIYCHAQDTQGPRHVRKVNVSNREFRSRYPLLNVDCEKWIFAQ